MRIGIDATGLYGQRTGIENYILNIATGLLAIDTRNEYVVYCRKDVPKSLEAAGTRAQTRRLRVGNRKLYQQTALPTLIGLDRIDAMFYPGNSMALLTPCKAVFTVHDLMPLIVPQYLPKYHANNFLSWISGNYWKLTLQLGCKKADRIVAVSHKTGFDLATTLSVPAEKITIVHEGVAPNFRPIDDADIIGRFRDRYDLKDPFILCLGTATCKNLSGSILAFEILKVAGHAALQLVIVGSEQRILADTLELAKRSAFRNQIRFTGYFPDADLALLFNAADLLLFPSFYEGFGLPLLEAFACGLPVVTSNVSVLPEVAGDAALLVNPHDPNAIARGASALLGDADLRKRLVDKGLQRSREFTWERAARQTLQVLESVR
jgi:glycosyltransferase involved in cell wall biosynthesis